MPKATKNTKVSKTTKKDIKSANQVMSKTDSKSKKVESILDLNTSGVKNPLSGITIETLKSKLQDKRIFAGIVVLGLTLLAVLGIFYFKSWIVAATVNGTPITNLELINRMNKQFREQTITQMVNEKIILQEARKNSIVITQSDIDQKITELEKNVGGAQVLDSLLQQQGQTRDSVRDQLKIQLIIEKMYEKDATVSAEEVTAFVEQNAAQLRATESAEQSKEAADIIKQQKVSQVFNEKFQELKKNANVNIF